MVYNWGMLDFVLANWFWVALAVGAGGVLSWSFARGAMPSLEPGLAVQTVEREGGVFVDVRSAAEFGRGHITRAVNLPADQVDNRHKDLNRHKTKPVVVVCQNGMRARQSARKLADLGFKHAAVLSGGMNAWRDAQLPLAGPRKK